MCRVAGGERKCAPDSATAARPTRHKERVLKRTRSYINLNILSSDTTRNTVTEHREHRQPRSAVSHDSLLSAQRLRPHRAQSIYMCRSAVYALKAQRTTQRHAQRPTPRGHATGQEARQDASYPHAHYSTSPQHGAAPANVPGSEIRDNKPAGVQGGSPPTKNRQQIRLKQYAQRTTPRRITSSPQCTVDGEDWGAELQTTYLPAQSWQPCWRSP